MKTTLQKIWNITKLIFLFIVSLLYSSIGGFFVWILSTIIQLILFFGITIFGLVALLKGGLEGVRKYYENINNTNS